MYRISETVALIQTVDFFTPIVDDPYDFGRIAAANALSDVYAMGGRPITAMNIVCFPINELDKGILKEILRGGADVVRLGGAALVGGHSVEDPEIKYGLSVTGVVHPDDVRTNAGALPEDDLILTKPIGTGIIATAIKADMAPPDLERKIIEIMAELNRKPAEIMSRVPCERLHGRHGFRPAGTRIGSGPGPAAWKCTSLPGTYL